MKKFLLFIIFFSLFFLLVGRVRIAPPDLAFYYAYAHSLLFDLDFYYEDQYDSFTFAIHELYLTSAGYPANDWPIGTGVAWLPFFLLNLLLVPIFWLLKWDFQQGYSWLSQWIITYGATLVYSGGTVILSYLLCRKLNLKKSATLWATVLITGGSSFTYHLYVNSADSHPPSAFFIALFLLLWLRLKECPTSGWAFITGCVLGIAALIRPHNLLYVLTPLLDYLFLMHSEQRKKIHFSFWLVMAAASFVTYLPQMMLWKVVYGSWLALPRAEEVFWLQPHIYEMLFSDFHGMISWSPLFGLGAIGLLVQKRWLPYAIPLFLHIYIYAANLAWWAGGSFGNRRMVGSTPLFILGLAIIFQILPKTWFKVVAFLCAIWTWLLLNAEIGGTIQLDHYQPWREIFHAIAQGFIPGLLRHIAMAEWQTHAAAKLAGAGIVITFVLLLIWLWIRYAEAIRNYLPHLAASLLGIFLFLNTIAMIRTPAALSQSDVSDYIPKDRFTWVVYYEEGFYHLRNQKLHEAAEAFLAATIAEQRHPQPWMYLANISYQKHWYDLGYFFALAAMENGQTGPFFYSLFEELLNWRIMTSSDTPARYYNQRGVVRGLLGKPLEAAADFQTALALDSNYTFAEQNLRILQQRQQGQDTRFMWE
ncbi:MAG: hypothetical protein ACOX5R_19825 [bacterium]